MRALIYCGQVKDESVTSAPLFAECPSKDWLVFHRTLQEAALIFLRHYEHRKHNDHKTASGYSL